MSITGANTGSFSLKYRRKIALSCFEVARHEGNSLSAKHRKA
jgi:hypothetical protein